jgi:hypothetical protein|tara:strand:+ start:182 stop:301 length:120 start_codon:yes stop_codon:yes gene_type:complete
LCLLHECVVVFSTTYKYNRKKKRTENCYYCGFYILILIL